MLTDKSIFAYVYLSAFYDKCMGREEKKRVTKYVLIQENRYLFEQVGVRVNIRHETKNSKFRFSRVLFFFFVFFSFVFCCFILSKLDI